MFRIAAMTVALGVGLALPALAEADAYVGDWQCGGSRVIITRLGSIEVVESGAYRAGLFEERGGVLQVTWDRGGESRLVARRAGERLTLTGLGRPLDCEARR